MIKHNIDGIPRQAHLKELWDKIDAINKYLEEDKLVEEILKLDPNASICRGSVQRLEKQLEELEIKLEKEV
jgi:hypothetical protein